MHSSTVTVAVRDPTRLPQLETLRPADLKVTYFSGSGAGGQNRNKVQACCRLTHLPSGITKTAQTRSRESSFRLALDALSREVAARSAATAAAAENDGRRGQVGSGERSDKRRTYRFPDDQVTDHLTMRKARCLRVMAGGFDALWQA